MNFFANKKEYNKAIISCFLGFLFGIIIVFYTPSELRKEPTSAGYFNTLDTLDRIIIIDRYSAYPLREEFDNVREYLDTIQDSIYVKIWWRDAVGTKGNYSNTGIIVRQLQLNDTMVIEYSWWREVQIYFWTLVIPGILGLLCLIIFRKKLLRTPNKSDESVKRLSGK